MPDTPINGLPYPALGDAPNVPADIEALATALDTKLGTAGRRAIRITSGAVDTAVKTSHFVACTASFSDPGWPYFIVMAGGIRFSKFETGWSFYIQDTGIAQVLSKVNGVVTATWPNNVQKYFTVSGVSASLTGGRTLGLTAIKDSGDPGNGGQAYSPATGFDALIVPAPG
ncbi:hypothetical protein [Amycolatopsis sp. YIM 10]|uniref:hypothetical protein n=1 Tax=Amycolatopsis sp. YIM 10 TaxID=2653857 RepID=UPI00129084F2|nr:hypothetical protein [Amycolatopsis sp. YIM 10]QFU87887.1 hypothetical protein YIM_13505 [Amycolatopsis sp. YIM 10]QFU94800.1 hypothetical protein YIM_48375 [Amycolatopsis sp. YIM 10]